MQLLQHFGVNLPTIIGVRCHSPGGATCIHTYIKTIYMAPVKVTVSERLGLKSH